MTNTLDDAAQRIADRGREELLARMRPAFEQAATAHADVLELDEQRLEQMVQRAADTADGVQWRRALASVASEELGIGLGEALVHPAVVKAQALAGAPSYEESLAQLEAAERETPPAPAKPGPGEPEPAAEKEPDEPERRPEDDAGQDEPEPLQLRAYHLHGVPDLAGERGELELSLTADGLDVKHADGEIIGRLPWSEIVDLEVPDTGKLRGRRRSPLIVRTRMGEATFDVLAGTSKLRIRLAPVIEHYLDS